MSFSSDLGRFLIHRQTIHWGNEVVSVLLRFPQSKKVSLWDSCEFCRKPVYVTLAVAICLASLQSGLLINNVVAQTSGMPRTNSIAGETNVEPEVWRFGKTGADSKSNGFYLLQFSPNGRFLAARNRDNVVQIQDLNLRQELCQIDGHESRILGLEFSPDSKFFITAAPGVGEKTKVWETETGTLVLTLPTDARTAHFNDRGDELVLLGDKQIKYFEWPGGKELSSKTWVTGSEQPVALSRDGQLVASYRSINNSLYQCQLTDIKTGTQILLDGPDGPAFYPKTMLISPNKQLVAANFIRQNYVGLWDLRDPSEMKYQLAGHDKDIQSIAFSADHRFLVSTSWDKTSIIWDLLTREAIHRIEGHSESVTAGAFSPIGLSLATGASGRTDSSVILWDLSKFLFPSAPKTVTAESFEESWRQLGSALAEQGLNAVNDLRYSSEVIKPLLKDRIGLLEHTVSHQVLQTWVDALDDPSFTVREQATENLLRARGLADALLHQTLRETDRSEVRYRITRILKTPITRPEINLAELRRLHRVVFLLELINDQAARDLLRLIASQHPHVDISQDAAAALNRMERNQ